MTTPPRLGKRQREWLRAVADGVVDVYPGHLGLAVHATDGRATPPEDVFWRMWGSLINAPTLDEARHIRSGICYLTDDGAAALGASETSE